MDNYRIENKDIEEVSSALKSILDMELKEGNVIFETWRGWPYNGIVISLEYPFKTKLQCINEGVVFTEVNDIRNWKSQYHDTVTGDMLICKFGI